MAGSWCAEMLSSQSVLWVNKGEWENSFWTALTWFLLVTLCPSYQLPLRSVGRNAVMSFLLYWLCVWVKHREQWFRQSAWPSARLRGLEFLPSAPPSLPLPCNILLSVTGLYKSHTVQTFHLEALCEQRKTITWKFLPFCWTSTRHRQEVRFYWYT